MHAKRVNQSQIRSWIRNCFFFLLLFSSWSNYPYWVVKQLIKQVIHVEQVTVLFKTEIIRCFQRTKIKQHLRRENQWCFCRHIRGVVKMLFLEKFQNKQQSTSRCDNNNWLRFFLPIEAYDICFLITVTLLKLSLKSHWRQDTIKLERKLIYNNCVAPLKRTNVSH